MKTLSSIIAVSLLVASAAASADDYSKRVDSDVLVLNGVQSKEAAYQLGLEKLNQLKTFSPSQLSHTLNIHSMDAVTQTISLQDNASITVNEQMDANGDLAYVSKVKVGFSYTVNDTDD